MRQSYKTLAFLSSPESSDKVTNTLSSEGHIVTAGTSPADVLQKAQESSYDFIILDIVEPGPEGWSLLRRLRSLYHTPIIVLSEHNHLRHRVRSYKYGADDYLPKPFVAIELACRIDSLARRISIERNREVVDDQSTEIWTLDTQRKDIIAEGRAMGLTPKEFEIFRALIDVLGETATKVDLYARIYNRSYGNHDRTLDMHVSNLRKKLATFPRILPQIMTIPGRGYMAIMDSVTQVHRERSA